jgi:UDP-N-acetylglucosamine diphosphorylase / glucose-1-phosphate thymidylyltransferase / UDP-N-acetylgalactosamine diphosphorylase / glucosamine-1-phosphate N-acetyltransferase / galactosamine-1-phosphate N-acetyltransferase
MAMRLVVFDRPTGKRTNFYPLALGRPIFDLHCGMTSLLDKLVAKFKTKDVAYFVPPYLADVFREKSGRTVNDARLLTGDDLLLVDARVKAAELNLPAIGPSQVGVDADGEVLYVRLTVADLSKVRTDSLDALLESAKAALPKTAEPVATWNYPWELVLANPAQITADFRAIGRHGIEGVVEEPRAIRGTSNDIYVAASARVHPLAVLDAEHGPIYIDQGAEVHPFSRIEGPCYVAKNSILFGCKCRAGNFIGPMCRVGGEIEQSILEGYSNKYHDGFLGHAHVGQWVNLGAMTTNSDLKNEYSNVTVLQDGRRSIDTGSTKFGCLIGDHAKTSIGTLLTTGAYVGAMSMSVTDGKPLPKFLPSFSWCTEGKLAKGIDRKRLYATAKAAMSRRGCEWTAAMEKMWDEVYSLTANERQAAFEYETKRR